MLDGVFFVIGERSQFDFGDGPVKLRLAHAGKCRPRRGRSRRRDQRPQVNQVPLGQPLTPSAFAAWPPDSAISKRRASRPSPRPLTSIRWARVPRGLRGGPAASTAGAKGACGPTSPSNWPR